MEKQETAPPTGLNCLYFNGFNVMMGNSDIAITINFNGRDILTVNTSFTIAKTLAVKLNEMITILESGGNNKILITDEVVSQLQKVVSKKE